MFYISKVFWAVMQPAMLLLILIVTGAVLLGTRYQRTGRGLVIAAAVFFVVGGLGPLSSWMILPLEDRFPRTILGDRPVDGIIILGGSEDSRVAAGRGAHALNESAERMTEAAALARRYPNAKVVFTGGSIEILGAPTVGADAAAIVLRDLGVGSDRLMRERKARNTAENAILAKQIADPKPGERWLLVTSAWHMPRAMGLFRKAGFDVEPWPSDYRTAGPGDAWMLFASPVEGIRRLDFVVKEWLGLAVNRLTGKSDELFPAP
ncbi:MAG: YdcF family protein [Hyphomicrobium sp.]|nr:YdcF family protein [Hyphomicrobium sp.]